MIDDKTRADFIGDAEEVQLLAETPVIPLLHLFEELDVCLQGILTRKGGAVDPRQHLVLLVAPPVGSGEAEKLEAGIRPVDGRWDPGRNR